MAMMQDKSMSVTNKPDGALQVTDRGMGVLALTSRLNRVSLCSLGFGWG